MSARDDLRRLLDRAERLTVKKANPRRDRAEPDRRMKEDAEDTLQRIIRRWFRWQVDRIENSLEMSGQRFNKSTKTAAEDLARMWFGDDFWNQSEEEIVAQLTKFLTGMNESGARALLGSMGLSVDPATINASAQRWAREYARQMIGDLNGVTRDTLIQVLTTYIETPGYTIQDAVLDIGRGVLSEERARTIAVTEVTRAYAQGQIQTGLDMEEAFPGLKMVKTWFTNNDGERVCAVCRPLHGKTVPFNSGWGANGESDPDGLVSPPSHPRCRCWITVRED